MLNIDEIPDWLMSLEEEDLGFIKRFLLSSGSLKDMAKQYDVSYPTVRNRLDKLIGKINNASAPNENAFVSYVKQLALDGKVDFDTAKGLIKEYRKGEKDGN